MVGPLLAPYGVQRYGPELEERLRRHLKPTNKSWRVDETYCSDSETARHFMTFSRMRSAGAVQMKGPAC